MATAISKSRSTPAAAGRLPGICRCVFKNSSGSASTRSRTTREPSRQAA